LLLKNWDTVAVKVAREGLDFLRKVLPDALLEQGNMLGRSR